MGNQQGNSEQENPQRLFPLREVHNKRLIVEVVCPTCVGEDIVCTLSKDKGRIIRQVKVAILPKLNSVQHRHSWR